MFCSLKPSSPDSFLAPLIEESWQERLSFLKDPTEPLAYTGPLSLSWPASQQGPFKTLLSAMELHLQANKKAYLTRARHQLHKDGLFLATFPGAGTLRELCAILTETDMALYGGVYARVHPPIDPFPLTSLMEETGFKDVVIDVETYTLQYTSLRAMIEDLRKTGNTNHLLKRKKTFEKRKYFERAEALYKERFGEITTTLQLVTLTGWAA